MTSLIWIDLSPLTAVADGATFSSIALWLSLRIIVKSDDPGSLFCFAMSAYKRVDGGHMWSGFVPLAQGKNKSRRA